MAHYSFIKDNIVIEVITGIAEDDTSTLPEKFDSWEEFYLTQRSEADQCLRTSYNTRGNEHLEDGTPFRGNYAGIGFTYDPDNDVFYEPQPFESWTLNTTTWLWEAPITNPSDDDNFYWWDEDLYQADTSDPKTAGWVSYES